MKLTYRNELTITLAVLPLDHLRMMNIKDSSSICVYAAKLFMSEVKCPRNTAFGGKITLNDSHRLECSIFEQTRGYAGKVIFVNPKLF